MIYTCKGKPFIEKYQDRSIKIAGYGHNHAVYSAYFRHSFA
ncbi:hypothetical protein HMPREF9419_1723 [Prevotella nigrescens ATCC 33563]|nr:hypothetical protein HMPREF9419_1723 [Prevotella nigrescens ATCC 33563]